MAQADALLIGGLNLTKLDHVRGISLPLSFRLRADLSRACQVRTMSLPKGSRKSDFLRPLWVLGMMLYMFVKLCPTRLGTLLMFPQSLAVDWIQSCEQT